MTRRSLLAALPLLLAACRPRSRQVTIGSKNFTEQLILGELLAQYLERTASLPVERRFYLAGTYICHQALLAGRIDLYVEYTGTALTAILKAEPHGDSQSVYQEVKSEYLRRWGLEVMPPLGFNNSFAIVMRGADARQMTVKSLSELAPYAPKLRMGIGYEFLERKDGYEGLVQTYGLRFAEAPRVMDLGLLYRALENRQVDLVAGSNTDGLIRALDLVVLEDDRHYFPPYDAVPIVRSEAVRNFPQIRSNLQKLAEGINADDMRQLNYSVDGQKMDAATVVSAFLQKKMYFESATLGWGGRTLCESESA
ncbi:MAG TPA: glycine betaine ABC transporter substrate-binding protein [Terriglobales bacterium]|nr:glycine betaine ABC transporter substrate-binding protein [Terriglobales bacterium]